MPREEAATMGLVQRPSAKGINYTNHKNLRYEQGNKTKVLNYNPDQEKSNSNYDKIILYIFFFVYTFFM